MSTRWADDYDTISKRMKEIAIEEQPKCPISPGRALFECLRSGAKCPENCTHHHDWIGPNA
jgi:hypothetical protein